MKSLAPNSTESKPPSTETPSKSTEGNPEGENQKSGSDVPADMEDTSDILEQHLESIFTIECYDPSLDATDDILAKFDAGEDAEFETVVAV